MIIYCDIDNTICFEDREGKHYNSDPKPNNIKKINDLYDEGHIIIYYTARGTVTKIDWKEKTLNQFKEWGVKYHDLVLYKPNYDLWIDDKAVNIDCKECMKRLEKV